MRCGTSKRFDAVVQAVTGPNCGDQLNRAPLAEYSERAAVGTSRDFTENGVWRVLVDTREAQGTRIAPHGVIIPGP